VIVPLLQAQDLRRRQPFQVELRNVPFKQQEQILFFIVDRMPGFLGGKNDARGNGQAIAEAAAVRYGHTRIDQVMLTEGWYRDNMPPFKAALEDGTLDEIPADKDTIDDYRALTVIKGVPRIPDSRTTEKGGGKRHGDAAVAGVLAFAASRNPAAPIEFTEAPPKADRWGDSDDDQPGAWSGAW
jgi:phage FluMu gp28-like protein